MKESTIELVRHGRVCLARINRPEALNALNASVFNDLMAVLTPLDDDPDIGCFVITGNERAFAAGADIRDMQGRSHLSMFQADFLAEWDRFVALRTPKVAAVSGYALGGGCELAMMCDTIYASTTAHFGQPELKLGLIPGMGGTQRLTRLIGKAKALDMILTGRSLNAAEAEQAGLVARVFDAASFESDVLHTAKTIAAQGTVATRLAIECVDQALECPLSSGLLFERRLYHSLFSTRDARAGITAFLDKHEPDFHPQDQDPPT